MFFWYFKTTTASQGTCEHGLIVNVLGAHLEGEPPVMLLAGLAVVLVHLHPVLPHQQEVPHERFKVQLTEDHAVQPAAP